MSFPSNPSNDFAVSSTKYFLYLFFDFVPETRLEKASAQTEFMIGNYNVTHLLKCFNHRTSGFMLERGLEHVVFRVHYAYRLITIVCTNVSSLMTNRPRVIKISSFPLHHFASVATLADLRKVRVLPPSFPSWKIFSPWSGKTFKTNHFKHQHADFSFITILCVCMSRRCWWCS